MEEVIQYVPNLYATFWALIPPLVAIILALITKEVYSSLFVGIVIGGLFYGNIFQSGFSFEKSVLHIFEDGLVGVLSDPYNVGILVFLVVLGIMVCMMNKAGGSAAFGEWAGRHIKTRVGAQLVTVLLGILIFIDDYFNCLTVGSVMRPVTEVVQELMSECTIAFMRAMDTYIINDNSLYSTYANFFMCSAISDYFRKTKGIKKSILNNMRALKNCIKKLDIEYEDSVNCIPQLAAELKWGEQRIRDTLYYLSLEYIHLDFYDLHDELFTESEYVMDEVVISDVTSDEIRNIVKNAISPRKLAILDARYDMGFFPEIQELKKTMTATDALNIYLGENRTCKYYCSTVTYILKELGRNKKLEKIFVC